MENIGYPRTRTVEYFDDYHGIRVSDPYRWLEDMGSAETQEWIAAQNALTASYIKKIPVRDAIRKRLKGLLDYEKFGMPFKQGKYYFFYKNDGLQNQYVLYVSGSLRGKYRVLIDPNGFSSDGTVALGGISVSDNGEFVAYSISSGGSDWQEWRVRNVKTGEDLPDVLKWSKFSGASWTNDGKGFFYARYDEPAADAKLSGENYFQKLYYHRIGSSQEEDELIYERPDQKEWGFSGSVTDDGKYLIISVWKGCESGNRVYLKDLSREGAAVVPLFDNFDAVYWCVYSKGDKLWFLTSKGAPRNRVICVDITDPREENWKIVIPETEENLQSVSMFGGKLVAEYLVDVCGRMIVFDLEGNRVGEITLPGIGTIGGISGEKDSNKMFYGFSGYTFPYTIYRYDLETGKTSVFRRPKINYRAGLYETRQIFYQSKDGTRVPMFITHKKGIRLDGTNPTILYGYGGFNISLTPVFSVTNLVWLEMGGVYAVANIRGGGEYGQQWHNAGTKANKQNVFDDFIAGAEWLIDKGYTSSEKLAISGGSNGGLLVGACLTQRPELFAAALPSVGVMDMLRFNKFTIGWAWEADYGSPQDPGEFKTLYAYSPYHNLRPGTHYPAIMATTADHDDRVVPAHSYKFISAAQAAQGGDRPVLIRIETKAGHGAGKPMAKVIEEYADIFSFLVRELNMRVLVCNKKAKKK